MYLIPDPSNPTIMFKKKFIYYFRVCWNLIIVLWNLRTRMLRLSRFRPETRKWRLLWLQVQFESNQNKSPIYFHEKWFCIIFKLFMRFFSWFEAFICKVLCNVCNIIDESMKSEHDTVAYRSGYDTGPTNPLPQVEIQLINDFLL